MQPDKASLRTYLKTLRASHSAQEIAHKSARICDVLLPRLACFSCVGGYMPMQSEVDIRPVMAALQAQGITTALPFIREDKTMEFRRFSEGRPLTKDSWGMDSCEGEVVQPDCLITPLLGFDAQGNRLGYGGGFYDRAIAQLRALHPHFQAIGVGFELQRLELVPTQPHDMRLDCVVSEL